MTPADVHQKLTQIFPEFAVYWSAPDNYAREDDGSFTFWGIFGEFSGFFCEGFKSFSEAGLTALGQFIEEWMVELRCGIESDIDNAVATCFLENVASHESADTLLPFLGRKGRRFLSQYGYPA